jgi:predicted secreted protein
MSLQVSRQAIGGSLFVAIFWIELLVNAPTIHRNIAEAHSAHTGIMLIAPAYQHQHN